MKKGIVSKNDSYWQGHPDVAYFQGNFYVVFRQSQKHRAVSHTQIMLTRSRNGMRYNQPVCIAQTSDRYNCPRLSVINNMLWVICDCVKKGNDFIEDENNESSTSILLWCSNNGVDWSSPIQTNITGILPDRICSTNDNGFLIATHTQKKQPITEKDKDLNENWLSNKGYLAQHVWKTDQNLYLPNWKRYSVAEKQGFNFCEASICNTGEELICLLRENSQRGDPCYWTASTNNGISWCEPLKTRMFGGHRPVLGKLSSGRYLTTYREQSCSHIPGYWAKNVFACLTNEQSMHSRTQPCLKSVILPLDHDNNARSDGGYTGWVETEDKQIYIVNYITKDAPKAYIVWYLIEENEF